MSDESGIETSYEAFYGILHDVKAVKNKDGSEYVEFQAVCDFIFFQKYFIDFENKTSLSAILEKFIFEIEVRSKLKIEDSMDIFIEIADKISPMTLINHICFLYDGIIVVNSDSNILIQKRESFKINRMKSTKNVKFNDITSYSIDL